MSQTLGPPNVLSRHSSIRGEQITEESKTAIAAEEKDIADSITSTNQQLTTLDKRFKQLSTTDIELGDTRNTEDTSKDEDGMQRTIGGERVMLHTVLEILKGPKTRMQDEARKILEKERKQSIQVTFGNNDSGLQLGVNNAPMSGFRSDVVIHKLLHRAM